MNNLQPSHLFDLLASLNLPKSDYAIFGSGPLYAHGLTVHMSDLDIIARGQAWESAYKKGNKIKLASGGEVVRLFVGSIEIFNSWGPGEWDVNQLIDTAEIIGGLPYVKLEHVLRWKRILMRPKDLGHIKKIKQYFRGR